MLYMCTKFQENISEGFKETELNITVDARVVANIDGRTNKRTEKPGSLYRAMPEAGVTKKSKQRPPAPTAITVCPWPYIISRTPRHWKFPSGHLCQNDVVSMSMRRNYVASTLIRRHCRTKCPLGYPAPSHHPTTPAFKNTRMFAIQ